MRIFARFLSVVFFFILTSWFAKTSVYAQTSGQPSQIATQTTTQPSPLVAKSSTSTSENFMSLNTDSDVPQNHNTYTQVVLIDALSAVMCQLSGIDPADPKAPCLGVNPQTGKIGLPPQNIQGQSANSQPQVGGAVGLMSQFIGNLYIPAVSSSQYVDYLASNFGIVRKAEAAGNAGCNATTFGYGFCGLSPIFVLWTDLRDFAYAMLTILFIAIGIGVMLRFRVDPRTVMTLQNQIPRVIIAIILITFSYAIAGGMVDLMWTATYAGINFISSASPQQSQVAVSCGPTNIKPLDQAAEQSLINQPLSFADMVFNANCNGIVHSGIFKVAQGVSGSFLQLINQVVQNLLGFNVAGTCDLNPINLNLTGCFQNFILWLTQQIIKLIILVAILIALLRLWFKLITCYLTFLIFVIVGPIWIVFGLIPGRPLGFEKWLRIIFANLAVFPLIAFLLVFARVLMDAIPLQADPQNVFIPPLVGNPNIATFTSFMGLGAIIMSPTVPDLIKDRLKATSQAKYGATIAAGLGYAAGAVTSPGKKVWSNLNRVNPTTGEPEGALSIRKQQLWQKTPFGQRAIARKKAAQYSGGDMTDYGARYQWFRKNKGGTEEGYRAHKAAEEAKKPKTP